MSEWALFKSLFLALSENGVLFSLWEYYFGPNMVCGNLIKQEIDLGICNI